MDAGQHQLFSDAKPGCSDSNLQSHNLNQKQHDSRILRNKRDEQYAIFERDALELIDFVHA